jgi:hypothetical protein
LVEIMLGLAFRTKRANSRKRADVSAAYKVILHNVSERGGPTAITLSRSLHEEA